VSRTRSLVELDQRSDDGDAHHRAEGRPERSAEGQAVAATHRRCPRTRPAVAFAPAVDGSTGSQARNDGGGKQSVPDHPLDPDRHGPQRRDAGGAPRVAGPSRAYSTQMPGTATFRNRWGDPTALGGYCPSLDWNSGLVNARLKCEMRRRCHRRTVSGVTTRRHCLHPAQIRQPDPEQAVCGMKLGPGRRTPGWCGVRPGSQGRARGGRRRARGGAEATGAGE
jgi:hypothetical protein